MDKSVRISERFKGQRVSKRANPLSTLGNHVPPQPTVSYQFLPSGCHVGRAILFEHLHARVTGELGANHIYKAKGSRDTEERGCLQARECHGCRSTAMQNAERCPGGCRLEERMEYARNIAIRRCVLHVFRYFFAPTEYKFSKASLNRNKFLVCHFLFILLHSLRPCALKGPPGGQVLGQMLKTGLFGKNAGWSTKIVTLSPEGHYSITQCLINCHPKSVAPKFSARSSNLKTFQILKQKPR